MHKNFFEILRVLRTLHIYRKYNPHLVIKIKQMALRSSLLFSTCNKVTLCMKAYEREFKIESFNLEENVSVTYSNLHARLLFIIST